MADEEQDPHKFAHPQTIENFEKFIKHFERYRTCYSSVLARLLTFEIDGKKYLIKGLLLPLFGEGEERKDSEIFSMEIEKGILKLADEVLPFNTLDTIRSLLTDQRIILNEVEYLFPTAEKTRIDSWLRKVEGREFFKKFHDKLSFKLIDLYTNVDEKIFGNGGQDSVESLRTATVPYSDMKDLVYNMFLDFATHGNYYNCLGKLHTELVVAYPIPIILSEESKYSKEGLDLVVYAPKNLNLQKIRIGVIGRDMTGNTIRRSFSLDEYKPVENAELDKYVIPITDEMVFVDVHISYGDDYLDSIHRYNPFAETYNPMYKMYTTQDATLEHLEKNLFIDITQFKGRQRSKKDKAFEFSVNMLFSMLGFITIPLGLMKERDEEMDIMLKDPHSATILFVECTLTGINKGNKIEKFVQKVNMVSDEFEGYEIVTAMMSPFGKQEKKSLTKAGEYEIAVLQKKDMEGLIQYAHQYATTRATIDLIKTKIPEVPRKNLNPYARGMGF